MVRLGVSAAINTAFGGTLSPAWFHAQAESDDEAEAAYNRHVVLSGQLGAIR